ncbi:unnamed protein product [Phytophthora fragariaefolia]|uniref:Unnamed protein product n=1 Tax=Phytophthora fragariaefolia TaxID=1490495 RepID=A0A9W7D6U1_9STRA|nr:unnamed protein product [Phytophthora fragariaefolia]
MSPSYADTVKLVEDNYFHWEFNMRIKLSRRGLLAHIIKPEFNTLSDRSTAEWKTDDLKALGVIAGDVSITYQMETIGEPLDETRQLVLLLGSLTDEYRMISTVLENTPNMTLAYAIQALSGVEASDESSSGQPKAFVAKKSYDKRRFNGKCFYCKKTGHKETECRKKANEERGHVARETSDYAFTATSAMGKTEWLVDSGASSHMTSVRDKFVSMKELKTPVRITIADGRKIDAVAMGTVGLKLMDGTSVTLSDVLYIPEAEGSLISVAKLAEKDAVAQFSKDKCVFRYGDATVIETKRCGNVYKLEAVGGEVCLPRITEGVVSDDVCAGCCMGKMRADDYPRHPEKLVKCAGVLDLVHTDVMGPMQTRTPGGCTFGVTFIDDYSRHVTVYFMKAKSEVLSKFKIYKAAMENATGKTIKRLRSDNGGEYTDKLFKAYLNRNDIKHERTVPYTPQQNGLAERMNRSLVEMARCMLYHEGIDKK